MTNAVVHWEIGGPDAATLRDFYSKAFGWGLSPAGPNYTIVSPGEGLDGGIMQTREEMPSYVTVYVSTDDLEAKLAEIESLGGKTVVGPTGIDDRMSFAMFADPAGNVVGLLKTNG